MKAIVALTRGIQNIPTGASARRAIPKSPSKLISHIAAQPQNPIVSQLIKNPCVFRFSYSISENVFDHKSDLLSVVFRTGVCVNYEVSLHSEYDRVYVKLGGLLVLAWGISSWQEDQAVDRQDMRSAARR
jgi:hypothetical protein